MKEPAAKPFLVTEFEDRAQEEMLDNLGAILYFMSLEKFEIKLL
jgi:hypothetical protein